MHTTLATLAAVAALGGAAGNTAAQTGDSAHKHSAGMSHGDSAYRAVQQRGRTVMGVDQYTSAHQFQDLPDGGRIMLEREVDDTAGVRQIRSHMRDIASEFARGDFSNPMLVHDTTVPGTAVMKAKRAAIRFTPGDTPRGGFVRITTRDAAAVQAVHEFLAFQRREHRTKQ